MGRLSQPALGVGDRILEPSRAAQGFLGFELGLRDRGVSGPSSAAANPSLGERDCLAPAAAIDAAEDMPRRRRAHDRGVLETLGPEVMHDLPCPHSDEVKTPVDRPSDRGLAGWRPP